MRRRNRGSQLSDLFPVPGKLIMYHTGYTFSGDGYTNPQGVFLSASLDDNGRHISLTGKGLSVLCPQPPDGDINRPKTRGRYWIKNAECLKCQFRRKGRICALEAERDRESFLKVMTQAIEEAQKR